MGRALELIAGQALGPGTTFTGLTMGAGNTLTVRNAREGTDIRLLQAWTDTVAVGTLRIRSPRLHDNVRGIQLDTIVSQVHPRLPDGTMQRLYPQDLLIAELTGSATGTVREGAAMLIYYADILGVDARLATWEQIRDRIQHYMTVENLLSLGTGGLYTGEEQINADVDLWKPNTDYALIGYYVDAECLCVRWRGADTGNFGLGGPGADDLPHLTAGWFKRLSMHTGLPLIPIVNSAGKAGFLIDGMQDEGGVDVTVTSIFAELSPGQLPAR